MTELEPRRGDMRVHTEPNRGNAPRHEIVRRLAVALAVGDAKELENLLAPGIEWQILGETTVGELDAVIEYAKRTPTPAELRVHSVITHGREACIDGEMLSGQGHRTNFCHILRFANAAKTAAITKVRTYQARPLGNREMDRGHWSEGTG